MAIDIGDAAINRANAIPRDDTAINVGNPANASGTITTIQVYLDNAVTALRVGTFYVVSGNTLKCRDSVNLGALSAGYNEVGSLSLTVQAGDYIGFYHAPPGGSVVDQALSGGSGIWIYDGECIDPDDQAAFTLYSGRLMSLYGIGTEPVVAPTVTTQAVSDIHGTTAVGNGNITDTGGEDCDKRGIVYSTSSHGDPGNTAPADSDYENYEEETGTFGIGAFTRDLTGLTPGETYYVRAYAHNSEGYSYGDEVDFTTLDKPVLTTQLCTNMLGSHATGNGNITDIGGETPTKRGICWNTTGTPTVSDSKTEETGSFGTGAFTEDMDGLEMGTLYYVRAYAWNSYGYGYGDEETVIGGGIVSSTGDGTCYNSHGDWDTCRAGQAPVLDTAGNPIKPVALQTAAFWIFRGFLYFDLSSVPAGYPSTNIDLLLYGQDKGSTTVTIVIVQGNQHDTLIATDYQAQASTQTEFGNISTDEFTLEAYNTIHLNAAGVTYVRSKFGDVLKLCLKDEDDNQDDPMGVDPNRAFAFYPGEDSGKQPLLLLYTPDPFPSGVASKMVKETLI